MGLHKTTDILVVTLLPYVQQELFPLQCVVRLGLHLRDVTAFIRNNNLFSWNVRERPIRVFYVVRWCNNSRRGMSDPVKHKAADKLLELKNNKVFIAVVGVEQNKVVNCRNMLATIQNRLLGHTKMYEIGLETVEKLQHSPLFGKTVISEISFKYPKMRVFRLVKIKIFFWNQNEIVVLFIQLFQIMNKPLHVASGR